MKKYILPILALVSFAAPVLAADPLTAQINADVAAKQSRVAAYTASAQYSEYTGAMRMESAIKDVMKMNKISREAATARYIAAIISQSGAVGRNPLYPESRMAFDPSDQTWKDLGGSHYAGYDTVRGVHMTTPEIRSTVRMDNFWYCASGLTYVYTVAGSVCR